MDEVKSRPWTPGTAGWMSTGQGLDEHWPALKNEANFFLKRANKGQLLKEMARAAPNLAIVRPPPYNHYGQ